MRERFLSLGKWAGATVTLVGILLLARICLPALLGISLPFLLAWGLALLVRPLSRRIGEKTVIPERILRACLALAALFLIGGGGFLVARRLWKELGDLLDYLSDNPEQIKAVADRVGKWFSRLPLPSGAPSPLSLLEGAVSEAVTGLSRFVGGILLRLPSLTLFLLVTVIASVYFAAGLDEIHAGLLRLVPKEWQGGLARIRAAVGRGVSVYLRSYALLFCVTLFLSLIGLLLLGVRYALLLALLLALIDLLPILGVGCALCPWAVVSFLLGNGRLGIGLLLLWLAVTVVRQVLEPRLLGERLGLHPLLTLFAMYAGLKLLGILGMLLAPLLLSAAKPLLTDARREKACKNEAKGSAIS